MIESGLNLESINIGIEGDKDPSADIEKYQKDEPANEEGIIDIENEKTPLDKNAANATESANKQSDSATYYAQLLTRLSLGGNTFKFDRKQTDFLALLVLLKLKIVEKTQQCDTVDKGILAKSKRLNTYIQYYKKIAESKQQTNYWKIVKSVLSDLTELCQYTKKTKFKDDVTSDKIDEIEESLVKELDIKKADKTAFLQILKTPTFTQTYLPKDFKEKRVAIIKLELFGSENQIEDVKNLLANVRAKFKGLSENNNCETFFSEQYGDTSKPIEEYDREYKDVCRPYLQSYQEALMADDPTLLSEKTSLIEAIQDLNKQHDQHVKAFTTVFDKFDIKFTSKTLAELKIEHKNADMKILEQLQEDLQLQGLVASSKNIDMSKADWVTNTLQDFSDRADAIIDLFCRKLGKTKDDNMTIKTLIDELKQKNTIPQETIDKYNIKIENYETKFFKLLFKEQIDKINENINKIAKILKNISTWKTYCSQFKSLLSEINKNVHTGRDLTFQIKCQSYLNENADDATIVAKYAEFERCIKENYIDKIEKDIQRFDPSFKYDDDDSTKTLYDRLFNLFNAQKDKVRVFVDGVQNPLTKFKQILEANTQTFLDKHFKGNGSKKDFIQLLERLAFDGFGVSGNVSTLLKSEKLDEEDVVKALTEDIITPLQNVYNEVRTINGKATDKAEKTVLQLISSIKSEVSLMQQIFKSSNDTKIEFTRYNGLVRFQNLKEFDTKNTHLVNQIIDNDWDNYRTNMPALLEKISDLYSKINPETKVKKTCNTSVFGDDVQPPPARLIPWFTDFKKCVRENYCAEFCKYDENQTLTKNLEKIKADLEKLAPYYEGGKINFMKYLKMVSEDLEKPGLLQYANVDVLVNNIQTTISSDDRSSSTEPNLYNIIEKLRDQSKLITQQFEDKRICEIDFDKHYLTKNFKLFLKKNRDILRKRLNEIKGFIPTDIQVSDSNTTTLWEVFCDRFNKLLSEIHTNIHIGVDSYITRKLKCSDFLNKDSDDVAIATGYEEFDKCVKSSYIDKIVKDIQRYHKEYKPPDDSPNFTLLEKLLKIYEDHKTFISSTNGPTNGPKKFKQLIPAKTQELLNKYYKVGGTTGQLLKLLNGLKDDEIFKNDVSVTDAIDYLIDKTINNFEDTYGKDKEIESTFENIRIKLNDIYSKVFKICDKDEPVLPATTRIHEITENIKTALRDMTEMYRSIPLQITLTPTLKLVTMDELTKADGQIDSFVRNQNFEKFPEMLTDIHNLLDRIDHTKTKEPICSIYFDENIGDFGENYLSGSKSSRNPITYEQNPLSQKKGGGKTSKLVANFEKLKKCIQENYCRRFYKYDASKTVNDNLEAVKTIFEKILELNTLYEGSFSEFQIFLNKLYKRKPTPTNANMVKNVDKINIGKDVVKSVDDIKNDIAESLKSYESNGCTLLQECIEKDDIESVRELVGEFETWGKYCEYLKRIIGVIETLKKTNLFSRLLHSCTDYLTPSATNDDVVDGDENFTKCIKQYFVNSIAYEEGIPVYKNLNNLYIYLKLKPFYGDKDVKQFLKDNAAFPGKHIESLLLAQETLQKQHDVISQVESIITLSNEFLKELNERHSNVTGKNFENNINLVDRLEQHVGAIRDLLTKLHKDMLIDDNDFALTNLEESTFKKLTSVKKTDDNKNPDIFNVFILINSKLGELLYKRINNINGDNGDTPNKIFETIREIREKIEKAEGLFGIKIPRTQNLQLVTVRELNIFEKLIKSYMDSNNLSNEFDNWPIYKVKIQYPGTFLDFINSLKKDAHENVQSLKGQIDLSKLSSIPKKYPTAVNANVDLHNISTDTFLKGVFDNEHEGGGRTQKTRRKIIKKSNTNNITKNAKRKKKHYRRPSFRRPT